MLMESSYYMEKLWYAEHNIINRNNTLLKKYNKVMFRTFYI